VFAHHFNISHNRIEKEPSTNVGGFFSDIDIVRASHVNLILCHSEPEQSGGDESLLASESLIYADSTLTL